MAQIVALVLMVVYALTGNGNLGGVVAPSDLRSTRASFDAFVEGDVEHVVFVGKDGLTYLIAHGNQWGELVAPQNVIDSADVVICCYPGKVGDTQGVTTMGDWFTESYASIRLGVVVVVQH